MFQSLVELPDPLTDKAAIRLQLRFTRPAQTDTAFLTFQVSPATHQARRQVPELCKFILQLALETPRALRKNI